ncbi:hypothetical protein B0O99DRAFT_635146 [Bisporella sp. PMI_857]|nr:hypothetical protein B0O99DRAFT_635146 [Bisporella sp. PMI_857]
MRPPSIEIQAYWNRKGKVDHSKLSVSSESQFRWWTGYQLLCVNKITLHFITLMPVQEQPKLTIHLMLQYVLNRYPRAR